MRAGSDRLALQPVSDDIVRPGERAAADEHDVGGVDLQELLLGLLAPALRRHGGGGALHDLEERMLDALARDVAGDGGIVRLAAALVALVDIDAAALRVPDVIIRSLEQLPDDVPDILASITHHGQHRRARPGATTD